MCDKDLHLKELEYINMFKTYDPSFGFNISRETDNARLGHHQSLETRKKISKSLRGIKRSADTISKIRESKLGTNNPMYGVKQSPETIEKRVKSNRKPIMRCDGKIYSSIKEAAEDIKSSQQVVSQALRKGYRAKDYRFFYLNEVKKKDKQ